jgi:hypothetical protein
VGGSRLAPRAPVHPACAPTAIDNFVSGFQLVAEEDS